MYICVYIDIKDLDKAYICEKIADAELHLMNGASESLQLLDVTAFIMRRLNNNLSSSDSKPMTH